MALTESNTQLSPTIPDISTSNEIRQPAGVVVREIIETLLLTFFIFWLVNSLVGRYRIDGSSMNPTLQHGEYLLINNLSYYLNEPQRGDIIVFHHPNSELNLIKRVIGLPGDQIEISDQHVKVNGVILDEPYIQAEPTYSGNWTVPEGEYFVLGDNRNSSSDSHSWQYLPKENIIGKAIFIYYPFTDWGWVPHFTHPIE
ncbi:MAG: signal peptidase I [Chloroflexi bacterium]|nr:signal peptidase I [Ardenticatenaceae bacterium]MBL1128865.1 signal peptidase I [Chloroflexota bacterium]NOG34942.1 signal peptidase I [Chloroflexota bacterium]GIK58105.1 MAG: signal peptidase I [Chloroflexota bacterium]